jgi:hypothetical protein
VEKVQKDLRILSKKPEQLDLFKSKYVKLSNQILGTLSRSKTSSSISPIKVDEEKNTESRISPPPEVPKQSPTPIEVKFE